MFKKLFAVLIFVSIFFFSEHAFAYITVDHDLPVGWHFLSFPGNNTALYPSSVFRDRNGTRIPISGKLISRDPISQQDIIYNDSNPVAFFGNRVDHYHGYWLNIGAPTSIKFNMNSLVSPVHIQLYSGLNTIGYPYSISQRTENLQVMDLTSKQTKSIHEARDLGWISSLFYSWKETTQGLFTISSLEDDFAEEAFLEPWQGYWVQSFRNDLELIIPLP